MFFYPKKSIIQVLTQKQRKYEEKIMESVIELFLVMMVIATVAFAPLGYFIYVYTRKNGEPFGDIEPHGDVESPLLNGLEKIIAKFKSKLKA